LATFDLPFLGAVQSICRPFDHPALVPDGAAAALLVSFDNFHVPFSVLARKVVVVKCCKYVTIDAMDARFDKCKYILMVWGQANRHFT
jgi:hypothetical protein